MRMQRGIGPTIVAAAVAMAGGGQRASPTGLRNNTAYIPETMFRPFALPWSRLGQNDILRNHDSHIYSRGFPLPSFPEPHASLDSHAISPSPVPRCRTH